MATLDAKTDPVAVNSFVFLANKKYYNCLTFHRVIPQFMNQTGDPTGTGSGGVGYTVQGDVPANRHPQYPLGSLAMAKTSGPAGTTSNQFFIVAGTRGRVPAARLCAVRPGHLRTERGRQPSTPTATPATTAPRPR